MADIKGLFSERAQQNKDFRNSIILPTEDEFNDLKAMIDVFPNLMSVDYVPSKFLKLIGQMFGFPYLETEDPEVQRDILKHLIEIYHNKGSLGLFEQAIKYSHDENYALGNLTYYHGPIEEASFHISYPRDYMFRYDYSKWDEAKWGDIYTVALGIIDIETSIFNERVETYLDRLIPAGIKYGLTYLRELSPVDEDGNPLLVYPYEAEGIHVVMFIDPEYVKYPYIPDYALDEIRTDGRSVYTPVRAKDLTYMANNVPSWMTPNMADKHLYGNPVPTFLSESGED